MISIQAREGFNHLLTQAIKSSLVSSPEDACEVDVVADLAGVKASKIVMLTVSSYLFRLLVLIHFTPDEGTRERIAAINKVHAPDMSEQFFHDAIAEFGNMCCGILNRDLGRFFPHIGMSTPNVIDRNCSSYLHVLGCGHVQHFKATVNHGAPLHFSLCVSDYADLDFAVDANEENANTGELELF